jgi:tripartite ATP-independent transporter DctM subunit
MEVQMTLIVLTVSFVLFVVLGMPIAFAIGVSSLFALLTQGVPLVLISHYMFSGVDSFVLCAIPMFVLAGEIMLYGGMTRSLTDLSDLLVGRIRGGLGHTNIMGSIFFAGITGSATADTTAIGSILIPAMTGKGYSRSYSTAITIASSVIGPIIPPSLTFVIYALAVGDVSIGGLFLAGIIPGILTGVGLMVLNYIISRKRNYEKRTESYSWSEIFKIVRQSIGVLVMPLLIVVGVLSGVYTATESAAAASAYALVLCLLFFKTLKVSDLGKIFFNSAKVSSIMFLLLATSNLFSYVLATENVPILMAETLHSLTQNPIVFLLLLNILLLLIGCVLDLFPAIFIFGPIFAPVAYSYGISPLHFGMIFCVNLLVGLNTPPVGSGLFIGAAIGHVKLEELIKEVTPFIIMEFIVLLCITYIPAITMAIPTLVGF